MKRATNFITPKRRPIKVLSGVCWASGIAAIVFSGWAFEQAQDLDEKAQILTLHENLAQEVPPDQLQDAVIPTSAEIADLRERVVFFNTLTGPRHASPDQVLASLETALDVGTWVRTLTYDVQAGSFALSLLSADETLLPGALQEIETLELFDDVILERQIRVRQGQRILVQYDIRGRTRP